VSGHSDLVSLHESEPMAMPNALQSDPCRGAQEDAKAFLYAMEMVAAALWVISNSGPSRGWKMIIKACVQQSDL
jgi:hypothetical protein